MKRTMVLIGVAFVVVGCGGKESSQDPARVAKVIVSTDSESQSDDSEAASRLDVPREESSSTEKESVEDGPVGAGKDDESVDATESPAATHDAGDPQNGMVESTEGLAQGKSESLASEPEISDGSVAMDEMGLEPEDSEVSESRPPPHYLLWLPTTKGPVLIGVDVWIGDATLAGAFESMFVAVLADAQESSEDLSWDDFIDHVAANPMKFGSNAGRVTGQKRNLIKKYDRNENKLVELEEAKRFVLRDSMFSSELRIYGTDAFRYRNRSKSRLFEAMDRDRNRELDEGEIGVACDSILAMLDANSDGCLTFAEAEPESEMESGAWNRRSRRHGDVAMDLAGFVNWNNVAYSLNGSLQESPLRCDGFPIRSLDEDESDSIEPEEAQRILESDPAVRLIVRYPETNDTASVEAEILGDDPGIDVTVSPSQDQVDLSVQDFQLSLSLCETARVNTQIPREAFDQLDANNDGGLDADEIPDGAEEQLSLETYDENEDGKLSYEELTQRRVELESIWASQVRGRAAEFPAALFAWLDRNHDHFLSARELESTSSRLSALLGERASLAPEDFPEAYLVQIGRGEPQQDDALFLPRRERRMVSDTRPTWAIRMDANVDGEIATIEFPGSAEQFRALDEDGDGYLSAEEVATR